MIEDLLICVILMFFNVAMFDVEIPVIQLSTGLVTGIMAFIYTNFPMFPWFNLLLAIVSINNLALGIKKVTTKN